MPELPEVETMRRGMARWVAGRDIRSVDVLWPTALEVSPDAVQQRVIGHRVTSVGRRGKVLIFDLDSGYHLVLHPRMTGQLIVTRNGETVFVGGHPSPRMLQSMPTMTTRAVIGLGDDTVLYFNDQRRFGRIRPLDTPALGTDEFRNDGGTSFAPYVNDFRGQRRSYLAHARVFHRQGQPCVVCGTTIIRIRVAGRGTNLCTHCQPLLGATDPRGRLHQGETT